MRSLIIVLLVVAPLVPSVAADVPDPLPPSDDDGKDVFVPECMGCTWRGSYKPVVETPVVTVWVYTCDPPT